jgi:uncharacterized protein (TIGR02231 family)
MKARIHAACLICLALSLFLFPCPGQAVPREVTLFPASAQVLETAKLKVVSEGTLKKAVFTLPAQADPASLVTRLNHAGKTRIMDQAWRQIVRPDDEGIQGLRKKIEAVKSEKNCVLATIRALETQIQFWQLQTKARVKTLADAGNLAAAIGRNVKKAHQDKLAREPEIEKLDKKIGELQDELNRRVGRKDNIWEVTLFLSGPPSAGEASVDYSYSLSGCGWSPLYRLEARPRDRHVLFTWEAEIWQSSGQDWSQVAMNLATLQPTSAIAPPDLPSWIIKPREVVAAKKAAGKKARSKALTALAEKEEVAEDAVAAAPREDRQSTYSLWRLGRVSLPAGVRQRVGVKDETWAADFDHVIRPGLSGRAFVRAAVNFPEAMEIPPGQAIYMMDGAILGKRAFAIAGRDGSLFFGEDPLVSAKVDLLSRQSGEKTFLADRQTYRWEWRTDVENRRDAPVRVRVEEPVPQSRDERIRLTVKNEPEPAEKSTVAWTWLLDVPSGRKSSIVTTIGLEAPRDMVIDPGWKKQ